MHILPEVPIGALVVLQQAAFYCGVIVDNGQIARRTRSNADGVLGSSASIAGGVALSADTTIVVLVLRALGHTVLTVPHMDALLAVICSSSIASPALWMAYLARSIVKLVGTEGE